MAVVVCGVSFIALLIYVYSTRNIVYAPQETTNTTATTSAYARSLPIRLEIPKIALDTTFVPPLGLNADQTVSVPDSYEEVGWYKNGASPGEIGSAVILGHVDSYEGPAIFYDLRKVKEGDEVMVTREDGTTATFTVYKTETVSQDNFPTEKVYLPAEGAELRLVTCTGTYNRGTLRYSHNFIAYARLKE